MEQPQSFTCASSMGLPAYAKETALQWQDPRWILKSGEAEVRSCKNVSAPGRSSSVTAGKGVPGIVPGALISVLLARFHLHSGRLDIERIEGRVFTANSAGLLLQLITFGGSRSSPTLMIMRGGSCGLNSLVWTCVPHVGQNYISIPP